MLIKYFNVNSFNVIRILVLKIYLKYFVNKKIHFTVL